VDTVRIESKGGDLELNAYTDSWALN
jgi:hypothetical protein